MILTSLILASCNKNNFEASPAANTDIEDTAIQCPRFPELEVKLLKNGNVQLADIDFSHRQLAVVAEQFAKENPHARLRLQASSAATDEEITEIVTLCGKAGLIDVIFNS